MAKKRLPSAGVRLGSRFKKSSFTGGMSGSGGMSGGMRMPSLGGNVSFRPGIKLGVTTKFKLNDPYWTRKVGTARAAGMRSQGALIRVVARRKMRRGVKKHDVGYGPQFVPSVPPRAPKYHPTNPNTTSVASVRNIQFDYNPRTDSLIVGSVFLRRSYGTTVPSVHEHGKSVMVTTKQRITPYVNGYRGRVTRKQAVAFARMAQLGHAKAITYKANKRVKYALRKERTNFPDRPYMKTSLRELKDKGRLIRSFANTFNKKFK